jgi:hypothetical protein
MKFKVVLRGPVDNAGYCYTINTTCVKGLRGGRRSRRKDSFYESTPDTRTRGGRARANSFNMVRSERTHSRRYWTCGADQ